MLYDEDNDTFEDDIGYCRICGDEVFGYVEMCDACRADQDSQDEVSDGAELAVQLIKIK